MAGEGVRKWNDEKYNHCIEEAQASYKCMSDNSYSRDACITYFKAYKDCKAKQNRERRGGGNRHRTGK